MSDSDATIPTTEPDLPVKEIRVEVVAGTERGLVANATTEPITVGTASGNTLTLTDRRVSRYHVEITRADDRIAVTDLRSTNGTDVGPVRLNDATVGVALGTRIKIGAAELLVSDGAMRMEPGAAFTPITTIVGRSDGIRRIMTKVEQLGATDVSVLLVGESGTGKELIARALHDHGGRSSGPFVTVDCGAITPTLFESKLFGHERGAFTGADRRQVGAFERAHGGTVFLDEVGELAPAQQVALLGVLERGRFMRVGGTEELSVDVRVVAATNRDLRAEVNDGSFRLDLYYRLAVTTMTVPPLRRRPEDIPDLIARFLVEEGRAEPFESLFPPDVMSELQRHRWPGNVRELRNVLTAMLATGEPPELIAMPGQGGGAGGVDPVTQALALSYREAKGVVTRDFERRYITRLLDQTDGNVKAAATLGRMNRSYLIELLQRHGLR